MFSNFDFSILDDPDFKEDAVREELVLPIIKALGYSVTGDSRIIRSKSLVHPYVAIGSQQRKVSIVPDYVFTSDSSPYWILDAKSPNESILKSKHVEQAYSYAIHPDAYFHPSRSPNNIHRDRLIPFMEITNYHR